MNGPIPAATGDAELDHDDVDANAPEYYAADQAAMVEADRLQDEVVDPAAEPAGPYEHTGAYQESELFDTSGVPDGFCPDCEHAPCVGDFTAYCCMSPRFIVVQRLLRDIIETYTRLPRPDGRIEAAFIAAFSRLASIAGGDGSAATRALRALERVLLALRAEDES